MLTKECVRLFACPLDKRDMKLVDKTIRCASGHSFDISREGYVNILTNKKRFRKDIGDNKEMLLSRERFLKRGYYDFLSEKINQAVLEHLPSTKDTLCILEVGSGTAFYLENLKAAIEQKFPSGNFCYFGMDISKHAAKFSAKKHKDLSFLVADTYSDIPLKGNTVTILLNIFSPRNHSEFHRLLKRDGLLLTVIPNNNHLHELVDSLGLIGIEKEKKRHLSEMFNKFFDTVDDLHIKYILSMDTDSVMNIVKMGLNYSRFDDALARKIKSIGNINVTLSFNLLLYKPKVQ